MPRLSAAARNPLTKRPGAQAVLSAPTGRAWAGAMRSRRLSASSSPTSFGCAVVDTAGVEILLMLARPGRVRHILANFTQRLPSLTAMVVGRSSWCGRSDRWPLERSAARTWRRTALPPSSPATLVDSSRSTASRPAAAVSSTAPRTRLAVSATSSRAEAAKPCGCMIVQSLALCGILSGTHSRFRDPACSRLQFTHRPFGLLAQAGARFAQHFALMAAGWHEHAQAGPECDAQRSEEERLVLDVAHAAGSDLAGLRDGILGSAAHAVGG